MRKMRERRDVPEQFDIGVDHERREPRGPENPEQGQRETQDNRDQQSAERDPKGDPNALQQAREDGVKSEEHDHALNVRSDAGRPACARAAGSG